MKNSHDDYDPLSREQRKKVGEALKENLVTPGATDRIYEEIFDEKIPTNEPLTPQEREIVDTLDTRWESRKPPIDESKRIPDPDAETQAAEEARKAREKEREAALRADLERRAELVKSTTIRSAPPHEGPTELPPISNVPSSQRSGPNAVQRTLKNILKFIGIKNV